jgi:NAD(P)-dependent dehydrogenase (short-subunit alcohol dehydrogenase family)
MTDELLAAEPEVEKTWMAGALLGRLGAPEDFKAPAVFLLADGSSWMTGADLRVVGYMVSFCCHLLSFNQAF